MSEVEGEPLYDREPQFARMSRRPAIGAGAVANLAAVIREFDLVDEHADVPSALRHGSRLFPLGRTLRKKLRKELGRDEKAPSITTIEAQVRMWDLLQRAADATAHPTMRKFRDEYLKQLLIDDAASRVSRLEGKARIFKKKERL